MRIFERLPLVLFALMLAACQPAVEAPSPEDEQEALIGRIESGLLPAFTIAGEPVVTPALADRMAQLHVPGVSVAVIRGGEIEWARGWGMADVATGRPVTPETRFQAASISKPVAAMAALALVEEGKLTLDGPVNEYLSSWQVPDNEFTAAAAVTLRGLVTHTAGLTVHGFGGYAAGEAVPSTVGVLAGDGNSDPVLVDVQPGTLWRYSGGGYTVMQLMIEDVTGQPFAQVMQERVLGPLGMEHSTYVQPLPAELAEQAAVGYRGDGEMVEGRWHTYPEQAAAGLWTTPSDLARWAMSIQKGRAQREHPVLSAEMIDAMLTEGPLGHGLGPAIMAEGTAFGHGGANEGYRCTLRALIDGPEGIAIMTNSDSGGQLAQELLLTVAREYDWDIEPRILTPIVMTPEQLGEYVGGFAAGDEYRVSIELIDGRLKATPSWQLEAEELVPDGADHFFLRSNGVGVQFVREEGSVVIMQTQGTDFRRQ